MHTNPIKVIWLTIGRHLPGSDLVVSDFNVSRNGEAGGMTLSVQHPNRGNDDGNREEAMAFARELCREFGVDGRWRAKPQIGLLCPSEDHQDLAKGHRKTTSEGVPHLTH